MEKAAFNKAGTNVVQFRSYWDSLMAQTERAQRIDTGKSRGKDCSWILRIWGVYSLSWKLMKNFRMASLTAV